jgi:hypothetical protein
VRRVLSLACQAMAIASSFSRRHSVAASTTASCDGRVERGRAGVGPSGRPDGASRCYTIHRRPDPLARARANDVETEDVLPARNEANRRNAQLAPAHGASQSGFPPFRPRGKPDGASGKREGPGRRIRPPRTSPMPETG